MDTQTTNPIAALNDHFRWHAAERLLYLMRQKQIDGAAVITHRVGAMPMEHRFGLLTAVRDFDMFSDDNDPYGEHDFGALDHAGERWFWKIDYYADAKCDRGSEDPTDPSKSYRVLTIMHASEY